MKNFKFVILLNQLPSIVIIAVYLIVHSNYCLGQVDFPNESDSGSQVFCETPNGKSGICSLERNCPQAAIDLRQSNIQPKLCYFNGLESVICCGVNEDKNKDKLITKETKERISAQKCKEFLSPGILGDVHIAVAGGLFTMPGEFPHMAALGWTQQADKINWRCGGTLISSDYVVTAAHCVTYGIRPDVIRIGAENLTTSDISKTYQIEQIIVHPDYRKHVRYHDIALIKFNYTAIFYDRPKPACLWQDFTINFKEANVTGYGHEYYGGKNSDHLLKANLTLVENDICREYYPTESSLKFSIIESQMCAGDPNAIKDTCQGDSGGPLQVQETKNLRTIFYLIGVTSFGRACAVQTPGVYTRISYYLDWIERNVWPTS